jgi:hypothetical protein
LRSICHRSRWCQVLEINHLSISSNSIKQIQANMIPLSDIFSKGWFMFNSYSCYIETVLICWFGFTNSVFIRISLELHLTHVIKELLVKLLQSASRGLSEISRISCCSPLWSFKFMGRMILIFVFNICFTIFLDRVSILHLWFWP